MNHSDFMKKLLGLVMAALMALGVSAATVNFTFDTDSVPDGVTLNPGVFSDGWFASAMNATGFWDLADAGSVTVTLAAPATSITVSVSYFTDGLCYVPPTISIPGATLTASLTTVYSTWVLGHWETLTQTWTASGATSITAGVTSSRVGFLLDAISVTSSAPAGVPVAWSPLED
jgi:hypothetical protein